MPFRVFWRVPHQTLCVELEGILTIDDFIQLDRAIVDHLGNEKPDQRLGLLIDITRPGTIPQAYGKLKASQTYAMRRDLKFILVAGSNKFMRLMMLLTFNLCRPSLRFFDGLDEAIEFMQRINPALQE